MPYSREEIPIEDLDLKNKNEALQRRHLRPLDDSTSSDFLGNINSNKTFSSDKFEFANSNLKTEREEVNDYRGEIDNNSAITEGLAQRPLESEEYSLASDDKLDRDVVHLKSDSLDINDLVKSADQDNNYKKSSIVQQSTDNLKQREYNNVERNNLTKKLNSENEIKQAHLSSNQNYKDKENNSDSVGFGEQKNIVNQNLKEDNFKSFNQKKELNISNTTEYKILNNFNKEKGLNNVNDTFNKNKQKTLEKENNLMKEISKTKEINNKENNKTKDKSEKIKLDFFKAKKFKKDFEILHSKANRDEKIEFIMNLVNSDGADYAVKVAEKTRDWYILDMVHDKLHAVS